MSELVSAFEVASNSKKIQILSLSPFSIKATARLFNASHRLVKRSRELKKQFGILPFVPPMSKGKVISSEMRNKVIEFYEMDENSRMCPGRKECITVRESNGQKNYRQKRLLLGNLKELYEIYKSNRNSPQIGFSSFCSLRPPYCILAGGTGTHTVCVCTYHQNPKLQLDALGECGLTYKDLMDYAVCDISNKECMLRRCENCDGETGVRSFLECLDNVDYAKATICYKQWLTTDRCTLIEKREDIDAFLNSLSKAIVKLTRHHFIAKEQSSYFSNLKSMLHEEEIIAVGDFSENYTYIIQDSAQGCRWDNSQCTIHPFIIYFKQNNILQHQSYCFISDDLKHTPVMVYAFISYLVENIKQKLPDVTKIHYFSDGCPTQYKNKSNFINICHHKLDFKIEAEWNFFATAHGKNACDGLGGTIKRSLSKASLQRIFTNQILTPDDVFKYCKSKLSENIIFFYIKESELKCFYNKLSDRLKKAKTIIGTQTLHRFKPLSESQLEVYETSTDDAPRVVNVTADTCLDVEMQIKLNYYVACVYDHNLWIGLVEDCDEYLNDYLINFLYPQGISKNYSFPSKEDKCRVTKENIIKVLKAPNLIGGCRIRYTFDNKDLNSALKIVKTHYVKENKH